MRNKKGKLVSAARSRAGKKSFEFLKARGYGVYGGISGHKKHTESLRAPSVLTHPKSQTRTQTRTKRNTRVTSSDTDQFRGSHKPGKPRKPGKPVSTVPTLASIAALKAMSK